MNLGNRNIIWAFCSMMWERCWDMWLPRFIKFDEILLDKMPIESRGICPTFFRQRKNRKDKRLFGVIFWWGAGDLNPSCLVYGNISYDTLFHCSIMSHPTKHCNPQLKNLRSYRPLPLIQCQY